MTPQHRLTLVQLVNWGTFNGSFRLPAPRDGLLLTGPSGSGKSSLLDAMAAVLVQPKWLSFNAAAQEGGASDRNRSLVSYVRGAYKREADDATGEVATAYLRTGATWSGVALTFDDGAGTLTTLLRLLHLPRGSNAADALNSLFVLADNEIELLDLKAFVENGINIRQLKAAHPSWSTHTTYSSFAAKLQRRLGLASDQAQRLLHKTQSAKNLTSLDTLLRDFMLDEPDTFELADSSVAQFQELSQAHASVVDARRQVELLKPLRGIEIDLAEYRDRVESLISQENHLRTVVLEHAVEGEAARLAEAEDRVTGLEGELSSAKQEVTAAEAARNSAQASVDGLGGGELRRLGNELASVGRVAERVESRREQWERRCRDLGLVLPQSAGEFAGFRAQVEARREGLAESADGRQARFELIDAASQAKKRTEELAAQLVALTQQQSNMDERLLAVRTALLESTGAPRERLPFAGELLDVPEAHGRWRGAIERVLRSFARTLLVPDDLYPHVAEFVEATHLGIRLVYERVPADVIGTDEPVDGRSLVAKLEVAPSEFSDWVRSQLVRRFDYRCVESVAELRAVNRGVTVAGQVKHSTSRHEKDDRSRIDDRAMWVLGTSTQAKQAVLTEALDAASGERARAEAERDRADAARVDRLHQAQLLGQLLELTWDDLDLASLRARLTDLEATAAAIRASNTGLAEAARQLHQAEARLATAGEARDDLLTALGSAKEKCEGLRSRLAGWRAELHAAKPAPEPARAALVARLEQLGAAAPERVEQLLRQQLAGEHREADGSINKAARRAERIMQQYKTDWPVPAADWGIQVEFLPDFIARLDALEVDRLPEFEDRFFTLLQTQSQNNIGILSTRLRNARREVRERVDPINASLRLTEYAPGQHLHVRVDDRRLPEVSEFLATLSAIVGGTLAEVMGSDRDGEAREQAEERFVRMQALLTRLASAEPADQRWRQQCLDTRQHVKFVAEVRDAGGHAVDFFTGAGGLSGGERQKLVVFCLAAALRYQLARDGAETPTYGLVVLDEAFDKTDPAFTKAGLEVFHRFGFQLLLATPLKMLQTLEDYVGGAAVVLNESGRGSRLEYLGFGRSAPARVEQHAAEDRQGALL